MKSNLVFINMIIIIIIIIGHSSPKKGRKGLEEEITMCMILFQKTLS